MNIYTTLSAKRNKLLMFCLIQISTRSYSTDEGLLLSVLAKSKRDSVKIHAAGVLARIPAKKQRGVAAKTDPDLSPGGFYGQAPGLFCAPASISSGVDFAIITAFDFVRTLELHP